MRSETQIKDMLNNVTTNLEVTEKDLALLQRHIKELKAERALLQWVLGQTISERSKP